MRSINFLGGVLLGVCLLRSPAWGQDAAAAATTTNAAANAAAVAEQQSVDEKFKQLAADIDSLRAADEAIRDKLSALQEDIHQIRLEQSRLSSNAISADDLKPLAASIEEVDKKRLADKDAISEQIKETAIRLERLITDTSSAPPKPAPGVSNPPVDIVPTEEGYSYTMKPGDNLEIVLQSYNASFKEKGMKTISLKEAEAANPLITDWKHLSVGQKIVIPKPPE